MEKIYKIYPAIGIGRIGDSTSDFVIAPEVPGQRPLEFKGETEVPVEKHKDSSGRIKRHGVRFRVFEFDVDENGEHLNAREITSQHARIEWNVRLANSKAAAPKLARPNPATGIPPGTDLRNPGIASQDLTIAPEFDPISGNNRHAFARDPGEFMSKEVFLGELRTDSDGRLIVLGGHGVSASIPEGLPIDNFANNPGWHDDVSDGPVSATITFPGKPAREVDFPAWVIFGPPDYAPEIRGITTLFDVAFQSAVDRGWLQIPETPSFRDDIKPIIERAANLRWVNRFELWDVISRNWQALSDRTLNPTGGLGNQELRLEIFGFLTSISNEELLDSFRFTTVQIAMLEKWRDGEFVDDFGEPSTVGTGISPRGLDRAMLDGTVGGGFFPGIEAGIKMTYPEIYQEPFRLTTRAYEHGSWRETLRAGSMTERMAVPWQADFAACQGNWWPAQRPDDVIVEPAAGNDFRPWHRGATSFKLLVQNFGRLGFIVPQEHGGETVFVESERDSTL